MKKNILLAVFVAGSLLASGKELSLAEARARIGEATSDPVLMATLVRQLPPSDQVSFVADVNEAIAKMPGSVESKTAAFLDANRAALKSASKGQVTAVLAEVFATVPPEALTVLNERFAADLFNRAADPAVSYTDESYAKIASASLATILKRVESADNASVRGAFAVLMFVRASNGTPADLADQLVSQLPAESRDLAKKDWLPPALSSEKSYEALLGAADAGRQPNVDVVLRLTGPDVLNCMLADLNNSATNASGRATSPMVDAYMNESVRPFNGIPEERELDSGLSRLPFWFSRKTLYTKAGTSGSRRQIGKGPVVTKEDTVAPSGSKLLPDGTVIDANGNVIAENGRLDEDGNIIIPAGTPIGPGGVPVDRKGRPVRPDGEVIDPTPGQDPEPTPTPEPEPEPYPYQTT